MSTYPRLASYVPAGTAAPVLETAVGGVGAAATAWPGRLAPAGDRPG